MSQDLCYMTATQALSLFRAKELSPVELLQAQIVRAETVEPQINAFTYTYFEEALAQAKVAEKAYMSGHARPLEGLPIAVKDECMIAGKPTSNGSLFMKDYVADHTDPVPQRLIDAGAVIHARSATPEFSMTLVTWSKLWGVTRNPWNLDIAVGGSSGGAGASLAAGTTALATGSDIGGSIRIPAAMNGVAGFKPPYGRVPELYPWNREAYAQGGPMARCASDLVLMQNVISGQHPADICSLPKIELPAHYESIKGMKIALSLDLGCFNVDEEIRAKTLAAVEVLRSLGAEVDEVQLDWQQEYNQVGFRHLRYQAGSVLNDIIADGDREQLTPYIRDYLEGAGDETLEDEKAGWAFADAMYAELQRKVYGAGYSVLICPTMTTNRIPADFDHSKDTVLVNGKEEGLFGLAMTLAFNILGRLPVVNMPIGRGENNVPIGLQIVGPVYEDAVPFQVAMAYEAVEPLSYQRGEFPL